MDKKIPPRFSDEIYKNFKCKYYATASTISSMLMALWLSS